MNWQKITRDLGPKLYRFFVVRASEQNAADMVQDTLLKLYDLVEKGRYNASKGRIDAFAFGVALNIQREHYRAGKKWEFEELKPDVVSSNTSVISPEIISLRAAIQSLKEPELSIVQLLVDRELGMKEIAQLLDMPVNTVKSHVHRAKANLKSALSEGDKNG